jgi:hypothetical protein
MALCHVSFVLCGGFHPVSLEPIANFVIIVDAFFVFVFCAKISLALPVISNFVPVVYEGYVKEHVPSKYLRAWGGFEDCVIGGANGPCRAVKEDIDVIGGY